MNKDKSISYELVINDLAYWLGENEKYIYNVIKCHIKRKTVKFESSNGGFSARYRINNNNDEFFRDLWTFHGRVCNVLIYNSAQRINEVTPYSGALFNNMV